MLANTPHQALAESQFIVPGCGILRREHLVVQVLNGVHEERFADQMLAESGIAQRCSSKMQMLVCLEARAKPPNAATRSKYARIIESGAADALGISFLMRGTGFAASMQRSVLTGYSILASHSVPLNVSETVYAAVGWFTQLGASAEDAIQMTAMLREVDAALSPRERAA